MEMTLTQEFYFEAAHALSRQYETDSSRRLHGHTYHAQIAIRGEPDPHSGMIVDLAVVRMHIDRIRQTLDHRLLNDIAGLGPPTLENLARFIAHEFEASALPLHSVRVRRRASGDGCSLTL